MRFEYCDGGRSKYFKGHTGDCVCRAICNATSKDYKEVYDALNKLEKETPVAKGETRGSARDGVRRDVARIYLESIGWRWVATMGIGSGCRVHMREDELPKGPIIVNLSRHFSCVINGVVIDTFDCTRDGGRCVYGYYEKI